jgi:3-deoxy-D-manno-octulosonic-acid transferase/heptosyltransferase-1
MNILIVKLSAIGDVLHTLPSLAAIRKLYPQAHITWVIEEASSDLIKGHPDLDRVIISRRKHWIKELKKGKISVFREVAQFIRELRGRRYDLVIDFHGLLKSAVIVFLSSGKRKLGYDSMQEMSGLFLTEKAYEDMDKHAVDRYLDLVRYLEHKDSVPVNMGGEGVSDAKVCEEEPSFLLPVSEEDEKKVMRLLESKGMGESGFVAVSPVALWETKLWEEKSFALLCDLIYLKYALPVVFTGTGKESIDLIRSKMKTSAISLAGETSLKELACLYRRAAIVISTDSGPMHIAAAMGTPVIALFGPTDPARTGPYGKGHRVIQKELPCRPCFLKKCTSRECMRRITVEDAFYAVGELLGTKPC